MTQVVAPPAAVVPCATICPSPSAGSSGQVLSRRQVLRLLGWGAVGAFFVESIVGALVVLWPNRPSGVEWFGVESLLRMQIGEVRTYERPLNFFKRFAIVRVPEGYIALALHCTHRGGRLDWNPNTPQYGQTSKFKGRFECEAHGGTFDPYGHPQAGPVFHSLAQFPLERDGQRLRLVTNNTIAPEKRKETNAFNF